MKITTYQKCSCGAITLSTRTSRSYSCKQENLQKFFPGIDLNSIEQLPDSYCCDHCVNHYGLDLCGCGSGEDFGECENGFRECRRPMQRVGKYTHVSADGAWA